MPTEIENWVTVAAATKKILESICKIFQLADGLLKVQYEGYFKTL